MKLLLLGGAGQVGMALRRSLAPFGEVAVPARAQLDLRDLDAVRGCVRSHLPDVVVNAAACTARSPASLLRP